MIVKKVPARPAGRNATVERAAHARRLVDYLRLPEKASAEKAYMVAYMLEEKLGDTTGERLFHIGGRGFVSTTVEGQRAEMMAVAQSAKRSPSPVDHWLLSWSEGELPTPGEVDEVVAIFTEHLGVADQPCIYACHGDTDNRHVHLALNRYDPITRRMIEINDGFNREAAHQAVALIVDRFGWKAERDARYEVVDGRPVLTASAQARIAAGREAILPKAAAFENRTGYRSAQRIAQEQAVPLIMAARSWAALHAGLAAIGITYDVVGTNGVTIAVGGERVKASSVDRAVTRTRLEKRLGAFQPPIAGVQVQPRIPEHDRLADAFRADEYRAEQERWRAWQERKRAARTTPSSTSVTEPAGAAARERQKPISRPPPNLESWYYAHGEGTFVRRWRNRHNPEALPALVGIESIDGAIPEEIDGYRGYACADGVRYARGPEAPMAFIDRGRQIDVVSDQDEALLAALRLAAAKFDGRITIRGSAEFCERAFVIAEANGLAQTVTNPDYAERKAALLRAEIAKHAGDVRDDHVGQPAPADAQTKTTIPQLKVSLSDRPATAGTAPYRGRIPQSARRRASGFRPSPGLASLQGLQKLGLDDRSGRAEGVLPVLPRDGVWGREPVHLEMRGSERGDEVTPTSTASGGGDENSARAYKSTTSPHAEPAKRGGGLAALAAGLPPPTCPTVAKGPEKADQLPTFPSKGKER